MKYVAMNVKSSRAVGDWFDYGERPDTMDVMVSDERPEPTGLYDADGRQIYRVLERVPAGFRK